MKYIFGFIVGLCAAQAFGIEYAQGVVKKVKVFSLSPTVYNTNDEALVILYVDELTGACNTNEKRVAIGSSHPLFDVVSSLALVSKTTKTRVNIGHLGTCTLRGNAWDFSALELLE